MFNQKQLITAGSSGALVYAGAKYGLGLEDKKAMYAGAVGAAACVIVEEGKKMLGMAHLPYNIPHAAAEGVVTAAGTTLLTNGNLLKDAKTMKYWKLAGVAGGAAYLSQAFLSPQISYMLSGK